MMSWGLLQKKLGWGRWTGEWRTQIGHLGMIGEVGRRSIMVATLFLVDFWWVPLPPVCGCLCWWAHSSALFPLIWQKLSSFMHTHDLFCSHAHGYQISPSHLDVAPEFQALEVQGIIWLNTLFSLQTSCVPSLLHLLRASQHLGLVQAQSPRDILGLSLPKWTNILVFKSYSFCFIRTSHISLLLPTSPLRSAMVVFLSSIWPPVVPWGAPLLQDTFQRRFHDIWDRFPLLPAHLFTLSSPTPVPLPASALLSVIAFIPGCLCTYHPPSPFLEHLPSWTAKALTSSFFPQYSASVMLGKYF